MTQEEVIEKIQNEEETLLSLIEKNPDFTLVDDCLVMDRRKWHTNDGGEPQTFQCDSAQEACQKNADTNYWEKESKTTWVDVTAWQDGIDADGNIRQVNDHTITMTVDAEVPDCVKGKSHDWISPHKLVGGCEDDPGVFSHVCGLIHREVCRYCGTEKVTDTWAQNPSNGQQGLESESYEKNKYQDRLEEIDEDD
jgi:hypothetical protein